MQRSDAVLEVRDEAIAVMALLGECFKRERARPLDAQSANHPALISEEDFRALFRYEVEPGESDWANQDVICAGLEIAFNTLSCQKAMRAIRSGPSRLIYYPATMNPAFAERYCKRADHDRIEAAAFSMFRRLKRLRAVRRGMLRHRIRKERAAA